MCCNGDGCTKSLVPQSNKAKDCFYADVSSSKLHLCFMKWMDGLKVPSPMREVAPPFLAPKLGEIEWDDRMILGNSSFLTGKRKNTEETE